jgi:hypothetical protein
VKHRIGLYFVSFFLFGFLPVAADSAAQSIGYRQTNLASNLPNVVKNVTPGLVNPWGSPFFQASHSSQAIIRMDASLLLTRPD